MDNNINIEERARAYAQEALKEQLDAVANAYIQGYNDAMANQVHEPISELYDKFVDMGLDSGTMWLHEPSSKTSNQWRDCGYYEALDYGLPTMEQFEEMFARCKMKAGSRVFTLLGPSSNYIRVVFAQNNWQRVWVKSDVVNDEAIACRFLDNGEHEYVRHFVGEKLRILRVKNKNNENGI